MTVKRATFLYYWQAINTLLTYLGLDEAEYREVIATRELGYAVGDAVYYITTEREL